MPATLPPVQTRFTSANAREMAARSWESRRNAALNATQAPQIAALNETAPEGPHARELTRLKGHIERIDTLLDSAEDAAEWRDLTNARTRLFDQWTQLAGIPKPGSRRPGREPQKRAAVPVLEPAPAASPNPAPEPPASTQ